MDLLASAHGRLHWAVGALEAAAGAFGNLDYRMLAQHVAAGQHHGRILLGALLP